MRGILGAAFLSLILSGASIAAAQGTAPAATAPSAAQGAPEAQPVIPEWLKYRSVYTGEENNIANPHRTADEMTSWAQQVAADVLSFSREEQDAKIKDFRKYFTPQGWQLYVSYLKDSKILNMVDQDGYSVATIVSQPPELANRGSANGVYHWIVKVPLTISFFKKDPSSTFPKPGPSGKFVLFVDIERVAEGGGEDGVAIVNWRVLDVPK